MVGSAVPLELRWICVGPDMSYGLRISVGLRFFRLIGRRWFKILSQMVNILGRLRCAGSVESGKALVQGFQIPLQLSVVYMDREKDAGFKGYQVPNTAIDVRSAIPSSWSRTASVYSPGCLLGLSKGSASSFRIVFRIFLQIVLRIVFRLSSILHRLVGRNRLTPALISERGWYSADPKRSDLPLANWPFYSDFPGGIEAFYVCEQPHLCLQPHLSFSSRRMSRVGSMT